MEHHTLDVHPIPKEKTPMFINEPWLIDRTIFETATSLSPEPEQEEDNIRVYIPLDINREAIFRRLHEIVYRYEEANEANEFNFESEVEQLVSQIEIYDQIWYVRHMPKEGKHSAEAISLVREFISRLEEIPDGCAETFPFEMIDELTEEYLK